ncbi:two-component system OmpR family response regulator/two-component system response regulator QseB [Idiomarina aquatica]|uniref:Two-component system OmpR family response regulator/two-component system response regulator QseB n=1 Tax=Idiomarina aquatica TaxID=1327752 RepID=A0A4R6PJL5_9GAMM|nr:response regulator transcription factor [Idiomarina aquatica]TDP38307.1 two-component system OmpR family response regulator/two-component system response regulator QseB [Idiomarina aquatica]
MDLLLVEDDAMLGQAVEIGLSERQFSVQWVRTGAAAISESQRIPYDVAVLDLGLPDLDGSRVLSALRKKGQVMPILVLTARDDSSEIVKLLDLGADDYMVKPFDMNELGARLRALVRRQRGYATPELVVGPIRVDESNFQVWAQEQPVNLSRREFELLRALMASPERVHSRDKLEQVVFRNEQQLESNALEVHVHNLRKKLGNKEWIQTIRGVGYRLACG